ncbi:calcium-binding protein [Pseudomonas sp. RIT-PI-S]|uniref:M10 family metallopeptidase C-terminal domain-containing protein n=1 Tax=Pseudomonas sp. RIT-PI-S TaxID=3035295 RepID=UPI0021DB4D6A|nr:calcium-binding protein [Pseudomonas sp. RIT-PI-S]
MATYNPVENASYITRYAPGSVIVDVAGFEEVNQSVTVQPDGKILVGGFSFYGGIIETSYDYSVVRLNADGTVDSDFGVSGRTVVSAEVPIDEGYSLTVQPDGAILVQRPAYVNGEWTFGLTRIKPDGTADTVFNANAKASIPPGIGNDEGNLSINADGSILFSRADGDGAVLVQIKAAGTLDHSFGTGGVAHLASALAFNGEVHATHLANGQFLLAGDFDSGSGYQYAVVRVNANGTLDTTFGHAGQVLFDNSVLSDYRGDLTVQADGKIVLAGSNERYEDFQVVRLNANGSYDTSFGHGGIASIDTQGAYDSARSVTVLPNGKILVAGISDVGDGHTIELNGDYGIVRLNADGTLDTSFSSEHGYSVDGSVNDDLLQGTSRSEYLEGFSGDDVYQGNGGRDVLYGGEGKDVFRFVAIDDSFRTASQGASDTLIYFNPAEDRIDLMGLGFTGIGNGHNGTLAVQVNAAGNQTYLKSYDYGADGHRFELVLNGNFAGQLNNTNVLFQPVVVRGTASNDTLAGSAVREVLQGLGGDDRLSGGADDDVLLGGSGRDLLTGGKGHDTFLYTAAEDSYRTASASHADVIKGFEDWYDTIDVSALGFTGLGDGTGGTLQVSWNDAVHRTYVKSLEPDQNGHRFELSMDGDHEYDLDADNFAFAATRPAPAATLGATAEAPAPDLVALGGQETEHHPALA